MSVIDVISDYSHKHLTDVPPKVLEMFNLKMLYLEGNLIEYLPKDFFPSLPKLTWLDLRNNWLMEIPENIANHECLQNLLLSNNKITKLPNELGLVPNLQVLHLNGNPITYPVQDIVDKGVVSICGFLKEQYLKSIQPADEDFVLEVNSEPTESSLHSTNNKVEITVKAPKKHKTVGDTISCITVKGLSKPQSSTTELNMGDSTTKRQTKQHKLTKSVSKITLHSHYNSRKYALLKRSKVTDRQVMEQNLKRAWLQKLKELINEQEKILQQERNLKAVSSWRLNKKMSNSNTATSHVVQAPYDTDPEYSSILSRKDLSKQIDKLVKQNKKAAKKINVDQLISEVATQLKMLDTKKLEEPETPRTKIANATKEMQSIIELHKRISSIQSSNDSFL